MASITISGGGLIGLFCADLLSSEHEITIIEVNAEIGFPANFPGTISNKKKIIEILESNNLSNLYILENNNQFNFRTEWFVKLLSYKLTRNKVDIIHRTRIEKTIPIDNKLKLILKGTELKNQTHITDYLIDFSQSSLPGPSNKNHIIIENTSRIIKPIIKTKEYFVGTCLINAAKNLTQTDLLLERSDGLVEVWYEQGKQKIPKKGWIESKNLNAYFNSKIMIVNDYLAKAQEIINTMVIS
tara:strand:+ start:55 stop:780 length:726 start_codon:yes stop_codon:yes gene_type:complete